MKAPCSGSQARALLPIYRGPARRAPPTSLKEPARLRHQPGACALFILSISWGGRVSYLSLISLSLYLSLFISYLSISYLLGGGGEGGQATRAFHHESRREGSTLSHVVRLEIAHSL